MLRAISPRKSRMWEIHPSGLRRERAPAVDPLYSTMSSSNSGAGQGCRNLSPTLLDSPMVSPPMFDHEKLDVYQLELKFLTWVTPNLKQRTINGLPVKTSSVTTVDSVR